MPHQTGLQRIICIDGHISGKAMEIRVQSHANLSGTNGAGKTTLLKLIPCFYGASPSQVVQKVGRRTGFVDYYLPKPTSLIIFEYTTHRGSMCVVIYRHASGDKPAYRFLGESFIIEHFSESIDNDVLYIEGGKLGQHWTMKHLEHSKQIEKVTDYRSIIQGDKNLLNRSAQSRELSQYIPMFSLAGNNGGMKHMDKMTTSILGRSGDMDRIKDMLADIMKEEGVSLPSISLHKNIREPMAELEILRQMETHHAMFNQIISKGLIHLENVTKMNELHSELIFFKSKATDNLEKSKDKLATTDEQSTVNDSHWQASSDDLNELIAAAKSDYQAAGRTIDDLNNEKDGWDKQDIETQKSEYDQIDHIRLNLTEAKDRLYTLEEAIQNLTLPFEKKKSAETQRHADHTSQLTEKRNAEEKQKNQLEHALELKKAELQQQANVEKETLRATRQVELDDLNHQISTTEYQSKHRFFTDEENLELEKAELAFDEAEFRYNESLSNQTNAEDEVKTKQNIYDEHDNNRHKAEKAMQKEQAKYNELKIICMPPTGTFLAELRAQQPDWHESLGRIIKEDLLYAKNLSPRLLGELNNANTKLAMGWQLDYLKLEKPLWASSLSDQNIRLGQQEEALRLATAHKESCEATLLQSLKALNLSKENREKLNRGVTHRHQLKTAAKDAIKQIKQSNRNAADARKIESKNVLQRLRKNLEQLETSINQDFITIDTRVQSAISEELGIAHTEMSRLENIIATFNKDIKQEAKRHQQQKKDLANDFEQLCSKQGVDTTTLNSAQKNKTTTQKKYDEVSRYQNDVVQYERWLHLHWNKRDQYLETLNEKNSILDKQEAHLKSELESYKKRRDALNIEATEIRSNTKKYNQELSDAKSLLIQLAMPLSVREYQQCRPLPMIEADCLHCLDAQSTLKREIKEGIGKAENIISRGGDDNPIATAWASLKADQKAAMSNPDDFDALSINLTIALEKLLAEQLPQKRDTLSAYVENLGGQLAEFYINLKEISKAIASQSRRISNAISSTKHFEAISDIQIALNSRIDKQDYWPKLEEFHRAWMHWKNDDNRGLPPPKIDELLVSTTDILHRSTLNKNIESVFDLEISLKENNNLVTVTSNSDLASVSSTGLSYLILCSIYAGIARMLCPDTSINLHWPMDELGTLAAENISRLFVMLNEHHIIMVGGFPTTDPLLLQHFKEHHEIKKGFGIIELSLPEDKLSQIMRDRNHKKATAI